jgi:hypothetical protein
VPKLPRAAAVVSVVMNDRRCMNDLFYLVVAKAT